MFNNYKNCLLNNEIILKSQERNTEEINKIAKAVLMARDPKLIEIIYHIEIVQELERYAKQSSQNFVFQMKIKQNIVQNGPIFQTIFTEY